MTAQDVAGVIARLRENPHGSVRINTWENINEPTNMIREAAALLESQAQALSEAEAEIARLKASPPLLDAQSLPRVDALVKSLESRLAEAMRVIELAAAIRTYNVDHVRLIQAARDFLTKEKT